MYKSAKAVAILAGALVLGGCGSTEPASAPSSPPAADSPTSQPAQEPSPTPSSEQTAQMTTYTTADGMLEFEHPADWTVIDGPPPAPGVGQAVNVLDGTGRTMATLSTGYPGVHEAAMMSPSQPTELDYQEMPADQLPLVFADSVNAFNFQVVYNPNTDVTGAVMSINNLAAGSDHSWLRGFDLDAATGASFSRWIDGTESLTGLDPDLSAAGGAAAFEAFMATPEYRAVRTMLLSLRQTAG